MKGMHTGDILVVNQTDFFSHKKDIPEPLWRSDTGITAQKVVRQIKILQPHLERGLDGNPEKYVIVVFL